MALIRRDQTRGCGGMSLARALSFLCGVRRLRHDHVVVLKVSRCAPEHMRRPDVLLDEALAVAEGDVLRHLDLVTDAGGEFG